MRTPRPLVSRLAAVTTALCIPFAVQAQVPAVIGTVYHDADQSGSMNNDEGLEGVSLQLFADNGNGVFDVDVDAMISTDITDEQGQYAFAGLGADTNYFVHQSAQMAVGGMHVPARVTSLLNVGSFKMMIDGFADQQRIEANPIAPVAATNLTSGSVIGGQRDLHVKYLSGPAEAVLHVNPFGMVDVLEFNQSANVNAVATITWDGIDNGMTTTPAAGGLQGMDLTQDGIEAFAFTIGVDAAGAGESLIMRIFTGTDVSTATIAVPVTNGTATFNQVVPLSFFVGDADLTSVDAIQLEIGGTNTSIDAQIGPIGLIGPTISNIAVPEPSSCLMLLFSLIWFGARRKRQLR